MAEYYIYQNLTSQASNFTVTMLHIFIFTGVFWIVTTCLNTSMKDKILITPLSLNLMNIITIFKSLKLYGPMLMS